MLPENPEHEHIACTGLSKNQVQEISDNGQIAQHETPC